MVPGVSLRLLQSPAVEKRGRAAPVSEPQPDQDRTSESGSVSRLAGRTNGTGFPSKDSPGGELTCRTVVVKARRASEMIMSEKQFELSDILVRRGMAVATGKSQGTRALDGRKVFR